MGKVKESCEDGCELPNESFYTIVYEDDLQRGRFMGQYASYKEAEIVFFYDRIRKLTTEFKIPVWFAVRTILRGRWKVNELPKEEARKLKEEYEAEEKAGKLFANLGKFVDSLEHVSKDSDQKE